MSPKIDERRPIRIRHIRPLLGSEPPSAATTVLTRNLVAADPAGVNGRNGWVSGTFELRLLEEGRFTIRLPNAAGADGREHADRFSIIANPAYEAGDEWLEIWDAVTPGLDPAGPLFVGTPTDVELSDAAIELTGLDALELLKTVHETAAGFWAHAPRDVFEAYSHAWVADLVETFDDPAVIGAGGRFATLKLRNGPDAGFTVADGRLKTVSQSLNGAAIVESTSPIYLGGAGSEAEARAKAGFRVETVLRISDLGTAGITNPQVTTLWGLGQSSYVAAGSDAVQDWIIRGNVRQDLVTGQWSVLWTVGPGLPTAFIYQAIDPPDRLALAIEVRGRWVYCYANGKLGAVYKRWPTSTSPIYLRFSNSVAAGGGAPPPYYTVNVDLEHWLVRSRRPFLMRGSNRGSYRLPGTPQAGGLVGSYFDDRDLVAAHGATERINHSLKPGREPVARRIDDGIGPSTAGVLPPGIAADSHSMRWTGAVNLDLAQRDIAIRITGLDDGARLYVGKTVWGDEYLDDWNAAGARNITGGSLRAHLGASEDGWYPIVLEYFNGSAPGGVRLEWATRNPDGSLGAFAILPGTKLSPQGVYEASVRGDSHYEQLQEMNRTFGYQWTLEPRSLESGLFPGELIPRIRVGADTERIITDEDLTDGKPVRTLAAREVIQGLILDAAGLAADGAQLSVEQLNFAELGQHLLIHEDALSLSDITIPQVLDARARTLQALRSTALEEVAFKPRGATELVDTFPLTGALTRLAWTPGLGVRLRFPRIRIDDVAPRQLVAVQRSITPAAIGPPEVSFRPRPRSQRAAMRTLARSVRAGQRQYQGQIGSVQGNVAANPAVAGVPDVASRVPWPADSGRVVGAVLVVHSKSDASAWQIKVNGGAPIGTGVSFASPGRFDVSGFVARDGANQRCYLEVVGGTGSVQFQLELKVRI